MIALASRLSQWSETQPKEELQCHSTKGQMRLLQKSKDWKW